VFHAVSCLLVCLPELLNNNNQPSTASYTLLHRDFFNLLTNIDLIHWIHSDTKPYLCIEL